MAAVYVLKELLFYLLKTGSELTVATLRAFVDGETNPQPRLVQK